MKSIFIAEIGINHNGSLSKAFRMIDQAKNAGANYAKFQYYDPIRLLGADYKGIESIQKCSFTQNQHEKLAKHCRDINIKYLVSVFDVKDILWADSICDMHKVASRMNHNLEFLAHIDKCKKPTVMSIQPDLSLRKTYADRWYFMWCVNNYPASKEEVLKGQFSYKYGLSSHCPDWTASMEAYLKGARIFENHVKEFDQDQGVDMNSSILFEDYKRMTDAIKKLESINY